MRLQDTAGSALNQRLESAAWGLFLIMVGGLWLIPNELVPNGAWLIGGWDFPPLRHLSSP